MTDTSTHFDPFTSTSSGQKTRTDAPLFDDITGRDLAQAWRQVAWAPIHRVHYADWFDLEAEAGESVPTTAISQSMIPEEGGIVMPLSAALNHESKPSIVPKVRKGSKEAQSSKVAFADLTAGDLDAWLAQGGNRIVITETGDIKETLTAQAQAAGVVLCTLTAAVQDLEALVTPALFGQILPQAEKLAAFNLAHFRGGLFLYVPEGAVITEPLEICWVSHQGAFHQRALWVIGDHAQVTLVERTLSGAGSRGSFTLMSELVLGAGAQVHQVILDTVGHNQAAFLRRYSQLGADAQCDLTLAAMGTGPTVEDIHVLLQGQGAQCQVAAMAVADHSQVQAINTQVVNAASHTLARMVQRGAVLDQGSVTFNGIGHIHKAAKQADSQQENRILMLSAEGRADANPILLIDEFEVQAGHAASVGRVDRGQLFYLMSRGLSRQAAEYLIIKGYLGQIFHKVGDMAIVTAMDRALEAKLHLGQRRDDGEA